MPKVGPLRPLLLLTLALTVGGCAGLSAGPAPATFAPDDLAFTLPRTVGSLELTVSPMTPEQVASMFESGDNEGFRTLLVQRGQDASALHAAGATGADGQRAVVILGARLEGMPGWELWDRMFERRDPGAPTAPPYQARDVGGKTIHDFVRDSGLIWTYAKGEALYVLSATDEVDATAAMAALP